MVQWKVWTQESFNNGTSSQLEHKDHVKYLGVLIDDNVSWKYHVAYICSRNARNTGIFWL